MKRSYDLESVFNKISEGNSLFNTFLEQTFTFFWNRKKTTYQTTSKNSVEYGVGWTYSNGHPLSADPSQIIWKITPDEHTIGYEGSQLAMVIGKVSETPTTTWHTDHTFDNDKFFHDYSTGDVFLNDGSLTLKGSNENINLSSGNVTINGLQKGLKVNSAQGYVVTPTLSTTSLTATNILNTGTFVEEFVNLTGTTIDCSLGNAFKYNSSVTTENFTFTNVPQNPNSVYKCTLHCYGNVTTDDFPNTVKWSRRSFYYDYLTSGIDYAALTTDLNGNGTSDTHIITFTTWDNGTNWFADDEKYAP